MPKFFMAFQRPYFSLNLENILLFSFLQFSHSLQSGKSRAILSVQRLLDNVTLLLHTNCQCIDTIRPAYSHIRKENSDFYHHRITTKVCIIDTLEHYAKMNAIKTRSTGVER